MLFAVFVFFEPEIVYCVLFVMLVLLKLEQWIRRIRRTNLKNADRE